MTPPRLGVVTALLVVVAGSRAAGADDAGVTDIEVPAIVVLEIEEDGDDLPRDDDLELASLVLSAGKRVSTVQETPAVVTIISGEDLRDHGDRWLGDALARVPGWLSTTLFHGQFPQLVARGTPQGALLLSDGLSLYDPMLNMSSWERTLPLELVDRVEVVSGPGGVIWGATSFVGIVNVITRRAEDVDGVEARIVVGDGVGDRERAEGYVLVGAPDLAGLSVLAHASIRTWRGPELTAPQVLLYQGRIPNPAMVYGGAVTTENARSLVFLFDGKVERGPLSLRWMLPIGSIYQGRTFPGALVRENLTEDGLPECTPVPADDPAAVDPTDPCVDRARRWRRNRVSFFDRYAVLEYRRSAGAVKPRVQAYAAQFVRRFDPLLLVPPTSLLEGGLSFAVDQVAWRAGSSLDLDAYSGRRFSALAGVETFHEWSPSQAASVHGAGVERLLPCPVTATWDDTAGAPADVTPVAGCPVPFAFPASRTVLAAYATGRVRLPRGLIAESGVRGQAAPRSLGLLGYDPVVLGAASLLHHPRGSDWSLKLVWTQGFRPPAFNNTSSNGDAIQIFGRPDLRVERSQAIQAEVRGRTLRRERMIRELDVRASYAYTRLDDLIVITSDTYQNAGRRGIHAAEALARFHLEGGHRMDFGYTWQAVAADDLGALRSIPNHWLHAAVASSWLGDALRGALALHVFGAAEDPGRLVEYRGLAADPRTGNASLSDPSQSVAVAPTDIVLDRLPSRAVLDANLRYRGRRGLFVEAAVHNALAGDGFREDPFQDYFPQNEVLPDPSPGTAITVSVGYEP